MNISLFKNILATKNGSQIDFNDFVNGVKFGTWKTEAGKISAVKDKKARNELKKKILPYVTPCGTFEPRTDAGLIEATGLICMDFDGLDDPTEKFNSLAADPFTYCLFRSVSGTGLAWIVQIDPKRFLDSFLALDDYAQKTYGILSDPSCKNISRARFVSFDANLFFNEKAKLFKNYLPKKLVKKLPEIVFGSSDVEHVLQQVQDRNIDLTQSSYDRYLKIAFALHSEYGQAGREFFHRIAQQSEKYKYETADKQYNYVARSNRTGITMATLFHYAKEAGLEIRTQQTLKIAAVAVQAKKGKRNPESAIQILEEIEGIDEQDSAEIVHKVFSSPTPDYLNTEGLTAIEQLELFLHANYSLKRNEITRFIENYSEPLESKDLNTIYIRALKEVDEKVQYEKIERLINSDFTPSYNPILEFFDTHRGRQEKGLIDRLAASITSDTGRATMPNYVEHFLTKWLVSIVASAHGEHSVLLLALTGGQNMGKTEFFRRLLPPELQIYYAESKLDQDKDDAILMTQKLIIMDDEMSGKSKQEAKKLKELTSKQYFTLREPYGKKNVTLKRLAVLCGTSNELGLLSDPTGNRRIIPVNVLDINHTAYNEIDKRALILEAYHLYQSGYNWRLDKTDIDLLSQNTADFEQVRTEYELIARFFRPAQPGEVGKQLKTATDIKDHIETKTSQKISIWKLGTELKAAGFVQRPAKINGATMRVYEVIEAEAAANIKDLESEKIEQAQQNLFTQQPDDLPF